MCFSNEDTETWGIHHTLRWQSHHASPGLLKCYCHNLLQWFFKYPLSFIPRLPFMDTFPSSGLNKQKKILFHKSGCYYYWDFLFCSSFEGEESEMSIIAYKYFWSNSIKFTKIWRLGDIKTMKLVWPCFPSSDLNVNILDPTETWLICECGLLAKE